MRHADRGSRWRAVGAEWPLGLVLALAAVGLALVSDSGRSVRPGGLVLAGALGLGAVLRTVLPTRRAGLLAVRGRALDCVLLTGGAVLLAVLVLATPPR